MGKKKAASKENTEEKLLEDTDSHNADTTSDQSTTAKKSVPAPKAAPGVPGLFSSYFMIPCCLMTITKLYANNWWRTTLSTIFRNTINDVYGGTITILDSYYQDYAILYEALASFVFFVAVLYMSRGSIGKGLVFGAILASVISFNWITASAFHLRYNPEQLHDVMMVDTVWHCCSSAIMGQFTVFIATFFVSAPSKKKKTQ